MQLFDITPIETGKSNEWYTPSKYIEAARSVMGSIDLDPASCSLANQTVKATRYYTKEENGLALPWYGNVWCNPPFSLVGPWVRRMIREYKAQTIEQAILLVPNDSTTSWYFPLWNYPISFPHKRIHFTRPDRIAEHPRFSTIFVYIGPYKFRFIDIFSQFGDVAERVSTPKQPSHIQSILDITQS